MGLKLTRTWLIDRIENPMDYNNSDEAIEAFKLALAGMDSEPDYIRYDCGCCGYETFTPISRCPGCNHKGIGETPLFTAPPAPVAVPDEWRMMCGEWKDEAVSIHDASGLIVSGIDENAAGIIVEAHNACCAATLKAGHVTGWIKCSERMPDDGQEVLIRIPVCEHFNIENGKYRGDGVFIGAWCSSRGNGCAYKVTHWMPLPAAPEQEV